MAGRCRASPGGTQFACTLSKASLIIRDKRFTIVAKGSKDKGSALLRVLTKLLRPASNYILTKKGSLCHVTSNRLSGFEGRGVTIVPRNNKTVCDLATRRGVHLTRGVYKERRRGSVLPLVGRLKVRRLGSTCPSRLSNNRLHHITVTETLFRNAKVLLTSRPASSLSRRGASVITGLLHQTTSDKGAIFIIARRVSVLPCTSSRCVVGRNILEGTSSRSGDCRL